MSMGITLGHWREYFHVYDVGPWVQNMPQITVKVNHLRLLKTIWEKK